MIRINKKRIRKDVRKGDLIAKTKNGWYFVATIFDCAEGVYYGRGRLMTPMDLAREEDKLIAEKLKHGFKTHYAK